MRTFEYCTNCREYKEFCEVDGAELCSCCGEPLEDEIEDLTYNTDDYEAHGDDDVD